MGNLKGASCNVKRGMRYERVMNFVKIGRDNIATYGTI